MTTHLDDVIDMKYFDYLEYARDEQLIIRPQLEQRGYTDIRFTDGERDCCGPLTRIVLATRRGQEPTVFWYG